jgi:phage-related protein
MNSTDDLRIIPENVGAEVLRNLNAVKHTIKNMSASDFHVHEV